MKYICTVCDWIYDPALGDPDGGIAPGTKFEDIPDSWVCPVCGVTTKDFIPLEGGEEATKPEAKTDDFEALQQKAGAGKMVCTICEWIYDEAKEGRKFEALPADWVCPRSKSPKSDFLAGIAKLEPEMTLTLARANAQKKLNGVCSINKVCDGSGARVCQGMKYGEKLGFGGEGQGFSFTNNFEALKKVLLKTRLVSTHHLPDTSADLFGARVSFPVLSAPMTGQTSSFNDAITEKDFGDAMLGGAIAAGTLGSTGNSPREGDLEVGLASIQNLKGQGIPFFKPQPNEKLIPLFQKAEKAGCLAVGSDLDGAGSFNWSKAGKPVERKNLKQLTELVQSVKIPVIFKGIMDVEDAKTIVQSGARGLGVSNHGGRVLDSTPGVAAVLPEIAEAVSGQITIFADGAVRTGYDVLKMLALGADFVFIGRPLAQCAIGGGAVAVQLYLEYVLKDFKKAMVMTGVNKVAEIDTRVLWGKISTQN